MLRRRLLVYPRGNKSEFLAVYLDAPEAPFMPANLNPKASFKLVLVNHKDPARNFHKGGRRAAAEAHAHVWHMHHPFAAHGAC